MGVVSVNGGLAERVFQFDLRLHSSGMDDLRAVSEGCCRSRRVPIRMVPLVEKKDCIASTWMGGSQDNAGN